MRCTTLKALYNQAPHGVVHDSSVGGAVIFKPKGAQVRFPPGYMLRYPWPDADTPE